MSPLPAIRSLSRARMCRHVLHATQLCFAAIRLSNFASLLSILNQAKRQLQHWPVCLAVVLRAPRHRNAPSALSVIDIPHELHCCVVFLVLHTFVFKPCIALPSPTCSCTTLHVCSSTACVTSLVMPLFLSSASSSCCFRTSWKAPVISPVSGCHVQLAGAANGTLGILRSHFVYSFPSILHVCTTASPTT